MDRDNNVIYEEPAEGSITDVLENRYDPAPCWKKHTLLSLDGGGIRGYWSLLALAKLMEYTGDLEEKLGNHSSFHPEPYPEHVSQSPYTDKETEALNGPIQRGSSTGALIAIMLGRFRMPVLDCLYEYETLGGEIFGRPRFFTQIRFGLGSRTKYKGENLRKVFEAVTARRSERYEGGSRITFASKRGLCKTFVTTLKTEPPSQTVGTVYLIRSYDHDERKSPNQSRMNTRRSTRRTTRSNTEISGVCVATSGDGDNVRWRRNINYGNAHEFQIWEVARAATAAPFYFEPLQLETAEGNLHFTDGGFNYTNNPTKEGAQEVEEHYGQDSIEVIVSVGTSKSDIPAQGAGTRAKIEGIADQATNPEIVHEDMRHKAETQHFAYYRLNDRHSLKIKLDEWKPKRNLFTNNAGSSTMKTIEDAFARWAANIETVKLFQDCAAKLVGHRIARAAQDPPRWQRFAVGSQFRCKLKECEREDFVYRDEFVAHLRRDHDMLPQDAETEADECRKDWRYRSRRAESG